MLHEADEIRLRNVENHLIELRRDIQHNSSLTMQQIESTESLIDAWKAARWLVTAVKVIASVTGALSFIWFTLKGIFWLSGKMP